jgi:hypothetical protein
MTDDLEPLTKLGKLVMAYSPDQIGTNKWL